jgi:putative endonuclease
MYYVYVLKSLKDGNHYVGKTNDLKKRFYEHCTGKVPSTKNRLPVEIVYYEASRNNKDATYRETYLKSAWGKRFIKHRIKNDI